MAAEEPIAAIATPPGPGGIAIVRLSGRGAQDIAGSLLPAISLSPTRRSFFHCVLHHPVTGARLDEAIVLSFPEPHSYTGEPVVEFQVHGGRIPARRVLEALAALGVRSALPGEFTRRAFLNGRLDLTEAEAVMDLIGAESDRAANAALEQLDGGLRRRVDPLYADLVALRADVEATLDFDEDAVPDSLLPEALLPRIDAIDAGIAALLATWREGRLLREGALVVLAGAPNAGKSSLFNALLATDRAIVSDEPGTTRDLLEESLSIDGIPLRLVDTAGLRETDGAIERQGVLRAEAELQRADLVLSVVDATAAGTESGVLPSGPRPASLRVYTKLDLAPGFTPPPGDTPALCTSAVTGAGLAELRAAISAALGTRPGSAASAGATVNERHRTLLSEARTSLAEARKCFAEPAPSGECSVFAAQSLRAAAESLGTITGRNVGEDVLDAVFSRFCIGK